MTLTDDLEERSRTDNGNHKNAPLMKPPKEEVIRFCAILPPVYPVIMYLNVKYFQTMVIVNPGDGTETGEEEDADRDQFINEMKADFEEGKQKVTQWKNNIINQGLGYSL